MALLRRMGEEGRSIAGVERYAFGDEEVALTWVLPLDRSSKTTGAITSIN